MFGQETIQIAKIQSVQICKPFTALKTKAGVGKVKHELFHKKRKQMVLQN